MVNCTFLHYVNSIKVDIYCYYCIYSDANDSHSDVIIEARCGIIRSVAHRDPGNGWLYRANSWYVSMLFHYVLILLLHRRLLLVLLLPFLLIVQPWHWPSYGLERTRNLHATMKKRAALICKLWNCITHGIRLVECKRTSFFVLSVQHFLSLPLTNVQCVWRSAWKITGNIWLVARVNSVHFSLLRCKVHSNCIL